MSDLESLICGCTPKAPCATGKFLFEKGYRSKRNRPTGLELHLRYALKADRDREASRGAPLDADRGRVASVVATRGNKK